MKLNLLLLSAAAMVNAASGTHTVNLGTAGNYVILSKSGISSVPSSVITGDIAVSPIAATGMTGFGLIMDNSQLYSTSTQITGKAYAPEYHLDTKTNLTLAVNNMTTAYENAKDGISGTLRIQEIPTEDGTISSG